MTYFDGWDALIGLGILVMILPLAWRKTHSISYLVFFSIFGLYFLVALQAVIFPFVINTVSGNVSFKPSINLFPFYFGNCTNMPSICLRDSVENILLTIPFGFMINFVARVKGRRMVWLACALGLGFEMTQLGISMAYKSAYRAVDINDAMSNAMGVLIGYALFLAFGWVYRHTFKGRISPENGFLAYI